MAIDYGSLASTFLQSSRATEQTDYYRAKALAKDEKTKAIGTMHMGIAAAAQNVKETSLAKAQNTSFWGQKMVEYAQRNMEFQATQANQQRALQLEEQRMQLMKDQDTRAAQLHDLTMGAAERFQENAKVRDNLQTQQAAMDLQARTDLGRRLGLRPQVSEQGLKLLETANKWAGSDTPILGALGRVLSEVLTDAQEAVPAEIVGQNMGLNKTQVEALRVGYMSDWTSVADLYKNFVGDNAAQAGQTIAAGMQELFLGLNPALFSEDESANYMSRAAALLGSGEAGMREFSDLLKEVHEESRSRVAAQGFMSNHMAALLMDDAEIEAFSGGDSATRTEMIKEAESRRKAISELLLGVQPHVKSVMNGLNAQWGQAQQTAVLGNPVVTDTEAFKNVKGDVLSLLSNPSQRGGYLTPVGVNLPGSNQQAVLWVRSNDALSEQDAQRIAGEYTKRRQVPLGQPAELGIKQFGGESVSTMPGGDRSVSYYVIGGSLAAVGDPQDPDNEMPHLFGMLPSGTNAMAAPWSVIGEAVTGRKPDVGAVELSRFANVAAGFQEAGYSHAQIFQDLQDGRFEQIQTVEEAGAEAAEVASAGPTYMDPGETALERYKGAVNEAFGYQENDTAGAIVMAATNAPNLSGLRATPEILRRRSNQASLAADTLIQNFIASPHGHFDLAATKWGAGDVAGGNAEIERAVTLLAGATLFSLSGQAEYGIQAPEELEQRLVGDPGGLSTSSIEAIVMAEQNALDPGSQAIYRDLRAEIHRTVIAPALDSFHRASRPVKALLLPNETEEDYMRDFDLWERTGGHVKNAMRGGVEVGAGGEERLYVRTGTRSPEADAALGTLAAASLKGNVVSAYGVGAEQLAMVDPIQAAQMQGDFLTMLQDEMAVGKPSVDRILRKMGLKAPDEVKNGLTDFLHNTFLGETPKTVWVPFGGGWVPIDSGLAHDFWNAQTASREYVGGQEAASRLREFAKVMYPTATADTLAGFNLEKAKGTWAMVRELGLRLGGKEPAQVATWLRGEMSKYQADPEAGLSSEPDPWFQDKTLHNNLTMVFDDSEAVSGLLSLLPKESHDRLAKDVRNVGTSPTMLERSAILEMYKNGLGMAFGHLAGAGVLRRHRALIDNLDLALKRAERVWDPGQQPNSRFMPASFGKDAIKRRREMIENSYAAWFNNSF